MNKQMEQYIGEAQILNQQAQGVSIQKQTLEQRKAETDMALKEIEKIGEEDIYKMVGSVVVEKDKSTIKKELEETKEDVDVKLKSLEKQEKRLKEKLQEKQKKIQGLASKKE